MISYLYNEGHKRKMKEYSVANLDFSELKRYDSLIILGTNNKGCFTALRDGLNKIKYQGRIVLIGHNNILAEYGLPKGAESSYISFEGNYDDRLVHMIQEQSISQTCVFFFSPDPFAERNDNILEIWAKVSREKAVDLVTMETGGRRVFRYLYPLDAWQQTDRYLQQKYYSERKKDFHFDDRRQHAKYLCMILAGYKEELYDIVFSRLKRFAPEDMDICLITSGKYSDTIAAIAEDNKWSYLSTKENSVSLVQNLAIELHPEAEGIYKLDEDIFVTKYFFMTMRDTYQKLQQEADFYPGVIAPLIPVHGYGSIRVLEKTNLMQEYASYIGRETLPRMAGEIFHSPEAALFMWGADGAMPHIDIMNHNFHNDEFSYTLCPIKFSISAIYFTREFWQDMGGFRLQRFGASMGEDENQICTYAMMMQRPIAVSENTLVGHLVLDHRRKP